MSIGPATSAAIRALGLDVRAEAAASTIEGLVLATVAVVLKFAGMAAGWGIQFQQPLFLVAMALLLTLFAANLWGLFEFHLPGAVADVAATAPVTGVAVLRCAKRPGASRLTNPKAGSPGA